MWPASTVFSLFGPRGQKVAHNMQSVRPTQSPIQVRPTQSPIQMTAGLLHQESRCVADHCYHLVPNMRRFTCIPHMSSLRGDYAKQQSITLK
jgi:hypothetical protein